jgi:hypothetical protein
LLNGSQGQVLAPNQEDLQEFFAASDTENKATKASEEAEQAPSMNVAPAKDPTQASALSTVATEGTGLEQSPPSNATIKAGAFNPTPANNTAGFAPKPTLPPAPTQQAGAQVAPGQQQAQVQGVSSQTSDDGESEAQNVSVTQKGQAIKQVFESSKSSDK